MKIKTTKIGYGTYKLVDDTYDAVYNALLTGYRLIDTAKVYNNEEEVGRAINDFIKKEQVKRSEIIVETKIWCDDIDNFRVHEAILESLKRLKLDYIDIILIHRPSFNVLNDVVAFEELINLKDDGLVKHIGVSNFDKDMINLLHKATKIYPEVNQIEFHPLNQRHDRVAYAKQNNILLQSYSPIMAVLNEPVLIEEAKKYNCSVSQMVLAWHIAIGLQPIVKATSLGHIKENFQAVKLKLSKQTVDLINEMNNYQNIFSETYK